MPTKIACVHCGGDVKGPVRGSHTGHVDARLDKTCGWWGFRRKDPAAISLGRRGGAVTSKAKASTARENGKRGGRPKKTS